MLDIGKFGKGGKLKFKTIYKINNFNLQMILKYILALYSIEYLMNNKLAMDFYFHYFQIQNFMHF